jgi:adhesin transport system outer membrane protein
MSERANPAIAPMLLDTTVSQVGVHAITGCLMPAKQRGPSIEQHTGGFCFLKYTNRILKLLQINRFLMIDQCKLALLALAIVTSLPARSQQPLPEPLVQAVRKAVATNPDVQGKWNGFQAADSQRDIARGGYFPQVDLSASVGTETSATPTAARSTYSLATTQLTLNQILFDGMFTFNEVKRLSAAKLTRYYELLDATETAALEAVRAYADVVRYRELVDTATQNYAEHKQAAVLVEERANSGVGRRVDVEQANGRLALAESNLLTELTNLHDVSARYLRVIGEKPPATLPSLPEPFTLGVLPASKDILMHDGLRHSPALLASVQNARSNRIAIDSSKAAYLPRLDLQLYSTQGANTGGVVGDSNNQGAAVKLTYNLFRGGADRARNKQVVSLSEQARDLKEKTCRDVRQTLSLAYNDSKSLYEQLGYIDRHRLAAEKTREAYRQQFNIGQRTLLDLLDTQNEFFEASRSYINTRHSQAAAQARTLAAMGQLVATVGVTRSDIPNEKNAGLDSPAIDPEDLCPIEESIVDSLENIKAGLAAPVVPKLVTDCGRITLLPEENGKVGHITANHKKGGEAKADKAYATILDDCDKAVAGQSNAEEVKSRYNPAILALPAAARYYRINFQLGKTTMVPESQVVLKALLEDYSKTGAPEVVIIGHSDKLGSSASNLKLSQARAKVVYDMLTVNGAVPASDISSAWRGDKDPIPGTEGSKFEPRNRRVEIKIQ